MMHPRNPHLHAGEIYRLSIIPLILSGVIFQNVRAETLDSEIVIQGATSGGMTSGGLEFTDSWRKLAGSLKGTIEIDLNHFPL